MKNTISFIFFFSLCGLAVLVGTVFGDGYVDAPQLNPPNGFRRISSAMSFVSQYGYEIVTNLPNMSSEMVYIVSSNDMAEVACSNARQFSGTNILFRFKGILVDYHDATNRLDRTMFYEPNGEPPQYVRSAGWVPTDMERMMRFRKYGAIKQPIVDINVPFSLGITDGGFLRAGINPFGAVFFAMDDIGLVTQKTHWKEFARADNRYSTNYMFRVAVPEHRKTEFADFMKDARARFGNSTEANNVK